MQKGGSAPTPPDPAKTAAAQTSSNIDTAIANGYLNATNQNTPYGSVRYNQTGSQQVGNNSVPTFESTVSLNPQYQHLLDSQTGIGQTALDTGGQLLNNVQGTNSSPFSLNGQPPLQTGAQGGDLTKSYGSVAPLFGINPSGNVQTGLNYNSPIQSQLNTGNLPGIPTSANDFAAQGKATTDALMSRFNSDWDRQNSANDVKLANQGIAAGSEAYGADKQRLDRARNDAMSSALLAGNQEQNTLFNQSLASRGQLFGEDQASGNFTNNAQQQGYGQALGAGNFANAAQGQEFGQNAAIQQAYNQAAGQQTSNNAAAAAFGNQTQQQAFGQDFQNANLGNQARQQSISEQQLVRNQPLNELATLLGFTPGINTPTAPNFGGNVAGTDIAGITQNNFADQMGVYQQKMAQQNAMMGGLFGLGSAGILSRAYGAGR